MGIIPAGTCFITGLRSENSPSSLDAYEYWIEINGLKRFIRTGNEAPNWKDDEWMKANQHILLGLFKNGKWFLESKKPTYQNKIFVTLKDLQKFVRESEYPKSPIEKLNNLFMSIFRSQAYYGEQIPPPKWEGKDADFYYKFFFQNREEYDYFLNAIQERGILRRDGGRAVGQVSPYTVPIYGLEYAISLQEDNQFSANAFVAMAFAEEYLDIYRDGIFPALKDTGFNPKRVDHEHLDSSSTINDSIIALIKQCRFIVADFTGNSPGVYTEAGIGIGKGMKVIYCCRQDYWDRVHFDMNHFPFIQYQTPEELRRKLVDKINAWVIE